MDENDEIKSDPLSLEYGMDLEFLREVAITVITDPDIDRLRMLCVKYGLDDKVTRENYILIVGKLSNMIFERFEEWNYQLAERVREKKPERKAPGTSRQRVPGSIE